MDSGKCPKSMGTHEGVQSTGDGSEETSLDELETLEVEVEQMAQKTHDYRASLPDQLKNTLTSLLAAQRPIIPDALEAGPSGGQNPDAVEQAKSSKTLQQNQATNEKVQLLKDKISSNVSAIPTVLKRLKDCIAKIEKFETSDEIIYPVFKRERPVVKYQNINLERNCKGVQ